MDHFLLYLVIVLLLLEFKTRRPDGTLLENLHPYRRLMQFVMPGRTESLNVAMAGTLLLFAARRG